MNGMLQSMYCKFFWFFINATPYHLGPYEPSYRSSIELHGQLHMVANLLRKSSFYRQDLKITWSFIFVLRMCWKIWYLAIQPTIRDPDIQNHMIPFQASEDFSMIDLSSEKRLAAATAVKKVSTSDEVILMKLKFLELILPQICKILSAKIKNVEFLLPVPDPIKAIFIGCKYTYFCIGLMNTDWFFQLHVTNQTAYN